MNPRNRNALILCVLMALATIVIWLTRPREIASSRRVPQPNPGDVVSIPMFSATVAATTNVYPAPPPLEVPSKAEIKQAQEAKINMAYATPIDVFGKVVDQNGNPIAGAMVEIGIADKPFQTGSKIIETTDQGGLFSLSGVHGIAFSVSASKQGYYSTAKSTGQRNVVAAGNSDLPQPTKEKPVFLVLHKQGDVASLIFHGNRQIDLPSTGRPLKIELATGQKDQGQLEVASWLGDTNQRPFNWRYQLSVLGGGILERKGEFDFEAPVDGYHTSMEINMPAAAEKWSSRAKMDYFAKLSDGRYARFSVRFYPGDRNFIVLESYVNPKPGDRNLEFDPAKAVTAP